MQRLLIVAGELSGDMHGARLTKALKRIDPSLTILGVGGRNMREAGVDLIHGIEHLDVVGVPGVQQVKAVFRTYFAVRSFLKATPPDLVILIDNPGLNIRIALMAKKLGISVVYYIAPQIWAWHRSRLKLLARVVDHLIVILPFEEKLFRSAGIPCTFVGHPLLDEITGDGQDKNDLRKDFLLEESVPVIAILPGSRMREIQMHLPLMLEALMKVCPSIQFQVILPIAHSVDQEVVTAVCRQYPLKVKCVLGQALDVMRSSDVVIVASGTATLQAGFLGIPMIIVYRTSWVTHFLARWLVQVEWIGLVNIVMERSVVPELIQGQATAFRLAGLIQTLLSDKAAYQCMSNNLSGVRRKFDRSGATDRAAAVIVKHLMKTSGGVENSTE